MSDNFKELQDVVVFGLKGLDAYRLITADHDFDLADLRFLVPLYGPAKDAVENIGNPVERFKALSSEEKLALFDQTIEGLDIQDHEKEELIQDTLHAVVVNFNLVSRWGHLRKTAA